MPTIHRMGSVKIDIYSRDHLPPHFHALYGEFEALILIRDLTIYEGWIPNRQYKTIKDWASGPSVRNMLLDNFYTLNPGLRK